MNTNKVFLASTRRVVLQHRSSLTYAPVRCSGGHDDHHHEHHHDHVKAINTQFQMPTKEEIEYQLPRKGIFNERIHQWIAGRWAVDRDDVLNNDKPNKFAAYFWFRNQSLLQNKLLLNAVRFFFDNSESQEKSHHEGFAGGVKASENGLFLYKSLQADGLLRSRGAMDYFLLLTLSGVLTGYAPLMLVPFLVATLSLPRKLAVAQYFTFHAELLPHTEQVAFHKVDNFGGVRRILVDIKNLEKIDAEIVPSKMLWAVNMFDSNMVFRDMESKEVFVFDANGIWNEDTLKHKLLF